ncbi:MAG: hypothetical protein O2924_03600 [Chloroflexi bacterium]|nr:hypothetical protein [Chloroflexota bacterium]
MSKVEDRRGVLSLIVVAALVLVAAGAYAGARLPSWGDGALRETQASLQAAEADLLEAQARIDELRDERREQQAMVSELTGLIADLEREVGSLQTSLGLSGPLGEQYTAQTAELADLRTRYNALQVAHTTLEAEAARLVRIRTPELPGDALLLDRGVRGVTYTGAVCSGSMEPNISCEDLLILYTPSVTDLQVGDIIYFPRRSADCSSILEGRFMLHRITAVTAGEAGIQYRTQGDALANPDACPVPANEVRYKLLTNIRGARIDG